jgi:ribose/xylose/arabinose/galactoside ABC-type transport system permease subunit
MKKTLGKLLLRYGVLLTTLILFGIFSSIEPLFASGENIMNLFREACVLGLLALAVTIVTITGGIDLGVAPGAGMTGVLILVLIKNHSFSVALSFSIGIALMIAIGMFKGVLVVNFRVPSFVATLGVGTISIGFARLLTGGGTFYMAEWPKGFLFLGQGQIGPVPVQAILIVVIGTIVSIILEKTRLGRYFYAVGGSMEAARHVGIRTNLVKHYAWILNGVFGGICACVLVSMLGAGSPEMGTGFVLSAVAATFLGAVAFKEGVPNVPGTLLAAMMLTILSNGSTMVGLRFYWKDVFQGLVLILAVGIVALIKGFKLNE